MLTLAQAETLLVDRQLCSFLQRTALGQINCNALPRVEKRTAAHCRALQGNAGQCRGETGPAKFNREQGGDGGEIGTGREIGNGDTAPGGLSFLSSSNSDNIVCAHSLMLA